MQSEEMGLIHDRVTSKSNANTDLNLHFYRLLHNTNSLNVPLVCLW